MYCPKCGKEIAEDSKFCRHCGFTFEATMESSQDTNKRVSTWLNMYRGKQLSLKAILLSISIGIWVLVLQNIGIVPINQDVNVTNTVDVEGSVGINGSVDANLQYINGRNDVFFNNPNRGDKDKYYVIPVTVE